MENEILSIYTKIIRKNKFDEIYNSNAETIDFPFNIELKINVRAIMDFNEIYFKNYENTLIINAVVYVLEKNDKDFLYFFNQHKDNLRDEIYNNILFRTKITELALKNIISKSKIYKNKNIFDERLNLNTINNNKEIFEKINSIYTKYYSITNLYRKFLYDFIDNNSEYIPDTKIFLDEFLLTKKYDSAFIFSTSGIINEENINIYKTILSKMILGDNYIVAEVNLFENDFDDYFENLKDKYDINYNPKYDIYDEYEEEYINMSNYILEYMNTCLNKNIFILPYDMNLRHEMYFRFFTFYVDSFDKEYDIDTIENNNEMKLNLKRINPLYKFDLMNFE